MESSWKRPESKMVKARAQQAMTQEEREDERDRAEYLEAQARKERQEKEREDKIGNLIGGRWFITEWTDPVLLDDETRIQMTVSRFYPDTFVAVDIFSHIDAETQRWVEKKRAAFKARDVSFGGQTRRVQYGALSYADTLGALLPQLGAA